MTFVIALVWLIGVLAAVPVAVAGGLMLARRRGWRPQVALPAGLALGLAAAPAFLMSAYFIIGWPVAIVLWLVGGAWQRFVGSVRSVQIALVVLFVIAWLAVTSAAQAADRYSDPLRLLGDGAILLSLLAACLIVLEFSAATWDRRDQPTPTAEAA